MNDKKICFISAVNNEIEYEECIFYINNLNIPQDYEIEIISIRNAKSLTSAYNQAMKQSDAKYKVYLHQDVFIINKNFISDMLDIFKDEKIGMIGMIGAEKIPTNAIWRESKKRCGKVYDNSINGKLKTLDVGEIKEKHKYVEAIDGLIMITQYDIEWRDDIFDGWHFYDISQSAEFLRKKYNIVVPKQDIPWTIHDCGIVDISEGTKYDYYREKFLDEYSKDIFPLVSILIPAYNRPKFFEKALESAVLQTYKNIEIIIGDDSTNNETKEIVKPYLKQYKNIKYIDNNGPLGKLGYNNLCNLVEKSNGEYINILMDDDVFKKDKIEKMINYYLNYDGLSLVTSSREIVNENGEIIKDINLYNKLVEKDTIFDRNYVGFLMLTKGINLLGEPTTALIKKSYIEGKFATYLGYPYKGLLDIAQWLQCLTKGDVAYISEPLSYFRWHSNQNQKNQNIKLVCIIDMYNMLKSSYEKGYFIQNELDFRISLDNWKLMAKNLMNKYNAKKGFRYYELIRCIDEAEQILKRHMCNVCGKSIYKFSPYRGKKAPEDIKKFNIIGSDIINFQCPYCGSNDRERHLFLYMEELELFKNINNLKILHIAPEINVYKKIKSLNPLEYICGDLFTERYDIDINTIDITKIQYNEGYFDMVICNHVLEHIENDMDAMKEIFRVLKKDGIAILQTPYSENIEKSLEDECINTDELRFKYYGQEDHVRIYGLDLFTRLKNSGFKLNILKHKELFDSQISKYIGVNERESLIMVKK